MEPTTILVLALLAIYNTSLGLVLLLKPSNLHQYDMEAWIVTWVPLFNTVAAVVLIGIATVGTIRGTYRPWWVDWLMERYKIEFDWEDKGEWHE